MNFDYSTLITNRLAADVNTAKTLTNKIKNGETLSPTEEELVRNGLKGTYYFKDLNRVESACEDIMNRLKNNAYYVNIQTKIDWNNEDILSIEELNRIKNNLETLKNAYYVLKTTPTTDTTKKTINYKDANDMEKILSDINQLILSMQRNIIRCGVATSGQKRLWQQRFRRKRDWDSLEFNTIADFEDWYTIGNISVKKEKIAYKSDEYTNVGSTINGINETYNYIDSFIGGSSE